jgi:predicted protein tyrosine phosphatase
MNIHILSREAAQRWKSPTDGRSILIRMLEPRGEPSDKDYNLVLNAPERFLEVLEVYIDDITQEQYDDHLRGSNFVVYNELDADRVVNFILDNKDVDDIIIHCHAGISRSSALGLAISEYFNLGETVTHIKTSGRYAPNETVYEVTKEEFNKRKIM